jgi:hypothetical protein
MGLLTILARRVLSSQEENPSEIDQPLAIEMESVYSRPAGWRQSKNEREVMAPDEMVPPSLKPGVEQDHRRSRDRVHAFRLDVLVVVAPLAGQGKVLEIVHRASGERNDVLQGKGLSREAFLASAVLAAPPSA